ncbi:major facilitator superfamily domain-containing protein [Roridomyces roridus]|uniref:Major facilitator superfamily domain-containing protein n=1 Tax=Roridomyces roridus TaxID=1738132 RepID=A0AAD7FX07_9AGAR|nr:major facilitator superfamily domain-containing protein [Roridomyces roridus]
MSGGAPSLVGVADDEQTTKISQESEKIVPLIDDIYAQEYPDGGARAWLVVFGTACVTFSTFGYVNAWGAFQDFYQETLLRDSSASNMQRMDRLCTGSSFFLNAFLSLNAWQYSMVFFPAVISGHYFDRGYFKIPFFIASVVLIAATFLVAQCTTYWQFLLCQGFLVGICCGILFGSMNAVVGHWFKKKRGIATGLLAAGSSVGGTMVPIVVRNLIPRVGFPWTIRIMGFILVFSLGTANLTVRRRLPPKHVPGGLFHFAAFKNPAYSVYCVSAIMAFLGIYTVLTYIGVSAVHAGLPSGFSFYLVSIANGASLLGRVLSSLAVDRYGPVNTMAPMTVLAALLTYVWPLARSKGSFVAIAVIYGLTSGAYVSSFLLPLFHLGDIADVGRRAGMTMSLTALGALAGPPISGAINTRSGGYGAVGIYAGSVVLVSVALMLTTRQLVLKQLYGKF